MRTLQFERACLRAEKLRVRLRKAMDASVLVSIFIVCLFIPHQLPAATLVNVVSEDASSHELRPFDARYIAYRSGNDIGTAFLQLALSDETSPASKERDSAEKHYSLKYESKVKRFFLSDKRYEHTEFVAFNDTLKPISYEYKRTGTGPNKALKLAFDDKHNKIIIDDSDTLEWEGEFDNQLFRIDLPKRLASGIQQTEYDFVNYRGEKRRYELEVVDTENLSIPYGQLQAIKVKINRESNSRVTYAWFAPSLNHNLVRLQQFKDGKEQGDIQLSSFAYLGSQ